MGGQGSFSEEGQPELHFEERVGIFQANWDEAGKIVLVTQSYPTLCDLVDCSLPGSSVHGILQARILEWVPIPFSKRSFQLRD